RRQPNVSRGACAAGPREPRRRADDSGARTLAQATAGHLHARGCCGIGHGRRSTRECRLRVGPTFLGAPHDNLPTAQGLDAEGEATNGQGPVAYPCSPELLNRHAERHVLRMATWKADELTDDVQGNASVEAPFPARNFAEDVP